MSAATHEERIAAVFAALDAGDTERAHALALEARVEYDVARWGEDQRDTSRRMHTGRSLGLTVNSLVVADLDYIDTPAGIAARKRVSKLLTSADRAELRKGG